MKIVLDTNVLVSGLLNPHGAPGAIVRMVSSSTLTLCYDARILTEYRGVLSRPKFQFNIQHIDIFLAQIQSTGHVISALPLSQILPGPDDEPFLAVAIAAPAEHLVTGNIKHFPESTRQNISVVSPAEFLNLVSL